MRIEAGWGGKFYIFVMFFIVRGILSQCTPDCQYTASGIYPDQLPTAYINSPYSVTLTFVLPPDSTLPDGTYVLIDSIRVDSITGLPPSISAACNNLKCLWSGGTKGCILLSGTPTYSEYGLHPLLAFETIWVRVKIGNSYIPTVTNDTTKKYSLMVDWPQGIYKYHQFIDKEKCENGLYITPTGISFKNFEEMPPSIYIYMCDGMIRKGIKLP